MSSSPVEPTAVPTSAVLPETSAVPVPPSEVADLVSAPTDDRPPVGRRYIVLLGLATIGAFIAYITPIAISLAIKVSQLAPTHPEYLGYITGVGGVASIIIAPLQGMLSDRTRSRFGRRRPWIVVGAVTGMGALAVMATSTSVVVLAIGWVLTLMTLGTAYANLLNTQADKLPEHQRGKVAGLMGFAQQLGPVIGVVLAGQLTGDNRILFLVPGAVGLVALIAFAAFVHEDDSRQMAIAERLTIGKVLRNYTYPVRRYADYSWNWLGRFFFFFGISFSTTFTAFFFAAKLNIGVTEVAGVLAAISGASVLGTTLGAIGGGFLSDRLKRRRVFVLVGAIIYAAGTATMAFAESMPIIVVGSVLSAIGLGAFSAVDQALMLDLLPERDTDAGRYIGIASFAQQVPGALAPLVAPLILGIGVAGATQNYTLLYLCAAASSIIGGLIIVRGIRSVR